MTGERRTLPQISQDNKASLDLLRAIVRNTPGLQTLGLRIGPARAYNEQEVLKIMDAYRARQAGKTHHLESVA